MVFAGPYAHPPPHPDSGFIRWLAYGTLNTFSEPTLSLVVVATPADIGVPDRGRVRRVGFREGAIEPILQDRLDRAVGGRTDVGRRRVVVR